MLSVEVWNMNDILHAKKNLLKF